MLKIKKEKENCIKGEIEVKKIYEKHREIVKFRRMKKSVISTVKAEMLANRREETEKWKV